MSMKTRIGHPQKVMAPQNESFISSWQVQNFHLCEGGEDAQGVQRSPHWKIVALHNGAIFISKLKSLILNPIPTGEMESMKGEAGGPLYPTSLKNLSTPQKTHSNHYYLKRHGATIRGYVRVIYTSIGIVATFKRAIAPPSIPHPRENCH